MRVYYCHCLALFSVVCFSFSFFFFLIIRLPPRSTLFPYTTLFRSLRNLGGSVGIALATTLLAQRSQHHQATIVSHVNVWDLETQARLQRWTDHFVAHGADTFTAQRRGLAMLYQDAVGQAQVLAYVDDFRLLAILFTLIPFFLPLMRRVSVERPEAPKAEESADSGRVPTLPAPVE